MSSLFWASVSSREDASHSIGNVLLILAVEIPDRDRRRSMMETKFRPSENSRDLTNTRTPRPHATGKFMGICLSLAAGRRRPCRSYLYSVSLQDATRANLSPFCSRRSIEPRYRIASAFCGSPGHRCGLRKSLVVGVCCWIFRTVRH